MNTQDRTDQIIVELLANELTPHEIEYLGLIILLEGCQLNLKKDLQTWNPGWKSFMR